MALPQRVSAAGAAHPDTAVSYTLDMEKAIAYADQWALSRNPLYEDFTGRGGNCANFVSQCMYAAGFPINGEWYMKHVKFAERAPWSFAHQSYEYFSGFGRAEEANENNIHRGDLVYYDWTGDGHIDHTTICVGKDRKGVPLVDSNTKDARHAAWKLGSKNPNAKYYVVHLNKYGIAEKSLSLIFDKDYYYAHNPDLWWPVGGDETALLRHFLFCGIREGRQGNASFDPKAYASDHPDVSDEYGPGYTKYFYDYMAHVSDEAGSVYRIYNPWTGEHFFTESKAERAAVCSSGWRYEGIGWIAPLSSDTPVYRLRNCFTGDHHYTADAAEKDALTQTGWAYEGIGWYSDDDEEIPVYRLYHPGVRIGTHLHTESEAERDYLLQHGWTDEGISSYGAGR